MNENFECELYPTEDETIKNCSNLEIQTIFKTELGSGRHGVVFPVLVKFGSKNITLILKRISVTVKTKKQADNFIEDMFDEVDYSYEMGKHSIGPRVYDAFFYESGHIINQYILMEKFDTSVANWILSDSSLLTYSNCQLICNKMLELLHKQIFVLNTFCGDIKPDNFVINFNPIIVRMIDFGIDWCSNTKLPKEYFKLKTLKNHSNIVKKEIFYCMCILQLFMNILNIGTSTTIAKMILRPFYKDDIFIKYVLEDTLSKHLKYTENITKRKSNKIDFQQILTDMLDNGHDQAVLLIHYIRKHKTQTNSQIVDYVFTSIKDMSIIFRNG